MKLTNTAIQKHIKTGAGYLRDSVLAGFGVRVYPSGKTVYIVEPSFNGKCVRRVIGAYPLLSVAEAREIAKDKIKELTQLTDLSPTRATLKDAFNHYTTSIDIKASTLVEYNHVYRVYLSELENIRIDEITEDMIIKLYSSYCERSIAQASKAMKILQAVLRYSDLPNNPVQILSRKRLLRQIKPRTSYIPLTDLPLFYKGLKEVKYSHVRLYLELLLHTGLRASEGMQITSSSVATGVLIITETKNRSDHSIPLTQWLTDNLLPFLEDNPDGFKSSDVRKSLITACQYLPYTATRHDLRRTFASYASEAGCDYLLIKRALNHSVSDITARYIQTSPKTLSPVFEAVGELVRKATTLDCRG